jgi:hypothetical protein
MRSSIQAGRFFVAALAFALCAGIAVAQNASFASSPGEPASFTQVSFTDTSSPGAKSWLWNFGDPASGAANTSTLQNPTHTFSRPGVYPVSLSVPGRPVITNPVAVTAGAAPCVDSLANLCLEGNRFQVIANWTDSTGHTGPGNAVKLTDDSGYFWFFDESNIEMVVKVLNGCAINNAYWGFAAGLTNVQVNWSVTDTSNNAVYAQANPQGTAFAPIQATNAFPESCP